MRNLAKDFNAGSQSLDKQFKNFLLLVLFSLGNNFI